MNEYANGRLPQAPQRYQTPPLAGYPPRIAREMLRLAKLVETVTRTTHKGQQVSVLVKREQGLDVIYVGGAVETIDTKRFSDKTVFHPDVLTDVWRNLKTRHGVSV